MTRVAAKPAAQPDVGRLDAEQKAIMHFANRPSVNADQLKPSYDENQPKRLQDHGRREPDAERRADHGPEKDGDGVEGQVGRKRLHHSDVAKQPCNRVAEDEHGRDARGRSGI
jgi:hypothetical protein